MTTEETELTFVRCPNCRSLIPAIATRCRMCGTQFDKKAEGATEGGAAAPAAADSFGGQKQSRVRQRTISATPDEVDTFKRGIGEQPAPAENGTNEGGFRLGGERREETIQRPVPSHQYSSPVPAEDEHAVPEEHSDDAIASAVDDAFLRPSAEPEPEQDEESFATPVAEDEEWSDDSELEEGEDDDSGSDDSAVASQPPGERKRRRRRRRKKRGTMQEGAHTAAVDQFEPVHTPSEPVHHSAPQPSMHAEPDMSYQEPNPNPPVRPETPRREQEQRGGEQPARSDGALVGWLVDFSANTKGSAIELRSGKFFVGRQKLRANDLVLGHQSISTPHCMVTAGGAEGLVVQDLMSDGGTYFRRGGGSYSLLQNTTSIEHGDWLKFGDYEVLVCLVPQTGRGRR